MNVYGRYALSRDETNASTFTGIGFLITIIAVIGVFTTNIAAFGSTIFYGIGFMILCGSMFKPTVKSKRAIAMVLAIGLCLVGLLALAIEFTGGKAEDMFLVFIFGVIAYQFVINALMTR